MPLGNGELVLVVDDDDEVREVTLKRLESLGYAVIDAGNGPEAVERCRLDAPIALALIDIVMPGGMSGYEVADAVRKLNPDIRVLLTSGYGGDAWEEAPGTPEISPCCTSLTAGQSLRRPLPRLSPASRRHEPTGICLKVRQHR